MEAKSFEKANPKSQKSVNTCPFCKKNTQPDYKDYKNLLPFISDRARILGGARTGVCARHQRLLAREIKRARHLGLLPFVPKILKS